MKDYSMPSKKPTSKTVSDTELKKKAEQTAKAVKDAAKTIRDAATSAR